MACTEKEINIDIRNPGDVHSSLFVEHLADGAFDLVAEDDEGTAAFCLSREDAIRLASWLLECANV